MHFRGSDFLPSPLEAKLIGKGFRGAETFFLQPDSVSRCCFSTSGVAKWLSDASSFQGGSITTPSSLLFFYHVSVSTTTTILPYQTSIFRSPSFQVYAHQSYMPAPVTSLITEHVSRGGIRDSRWPSKIWMGTRCFWCLLLTRPAADRHLSFPCLGISSANSMSLRHIITLRSTGSLLVGLTFTRSLVLSAVAFRSPLMPLGTERKREGERGREGERLIDNFPIDETFSIEAKFEYRGDIWGNIKRINRWTLIRLEDWTFPNKSQLILNYERITII